MLRLSDTRVKASSSPLGESAGSIAHPAKASCVIEPFAMVTLPSPHLVVSTTEYISSLSSADQVSPPGLPAKVAIFLGWPFARSNSYKPSPFKLREHQNARNSPPWENAG